MAVRVVEITGRNADKTVEETALTRIFMVTNNAVTDGPNAALTAVDSTTSLAIPAMGASYPGVPTATVLSKTPESIDGSFIDFRVTVRYSTRAPSAVDDVPPLNRPWEIEWSSVLESQAIDYQISEIPSVDGLPIVNSAGQPFDPPYEISVARPMLRVRRNEAGFSAANANLYTNAVNSDTFYGSAPYTAKILQISGRRFWEQNAYWWDVSYEVLFWPLIVLYRDSLTLTFSAFNLNILDNGLMQLGDIDGLKHCKAEDGTNVTQPVKLDGTGHQLATDGFPFYLSFSITKARAFAALGIE